MFDARSRFLTDTVSTATPAKLLTLLYDRLLLDLDRGRDALRTGDRGTASRQLCHAQDIVSELMGSLDVREWDGGPQLMSVYGFLHEELVQANVRADADRVQACRDLVAPLAAAWHEAARIVGGPAPQVPQQRPAPAADGAALAVSGLGVLGVG